MNLLSNAIKFTARGEVALRVRSAAQPDGCARVHFEVADTGIGIDPQAQSRLFEPFVQADTSTTRRFGGTGLGLSIVRQLVDLMGGEMALESALGAGSVFAVNLEFEACDAAIQEQAFPDSHSDAGGLAGLRILVVDDNAANQDVARRILEGVGATTLIAGNGHEAVEALADSTVRIDAVLMDVQMPVLDGLDATRRIRGALRLHEIPIVGLTAGVSRSEQERALAAGMNDVIGKPFDPRNLVRCLRRVTGQEVDARMPHGAQAKPRELPSDWPRVEGVDAHESHARLGGDAALFHKLLRHVQSQSVRLESALGDLDAMAALLHDLKGTAGTLGAHGLQELASSSETACRMRDAARAEELGRRLVCEVRMIEWPQPHAAKDGAEFEPIELDAASVDRLAGCLANGDLAALPLFRQLRPAMEARMDPAAFELLCDCLDRLDFSAAAGVIASWQAGLRPTLELLRPASMSGA